MKDQVIRQIIQEICIAARGGVKLYFAPLRILQNVLRYRDTIDHN